MCDNSHTHRPWRKRGGPDGWYKATQQEAEFPQLLCDRIVAAVKQGCAETARPGALPRKWSKEEEAVALQSQESVRAARQRAGQIQSRRQALAQLVPEYKEVVHVVATSPEDKAKLGAWTGACKKPMDLLGRTWPVGSKVVVRGLRKGVEGQAPDMTAQIGVGWSTSEFFVSGRTAGASFREASGARCVR